MNATTQKTMRAMVRDRYGTPEVFELAHVETPHPGAGQVLVRVHATSVNPAEWHMLTGTPYLARLGAGLRRPKRHIIGSDVSGVVAAVGDDVTEFSVGDAVFGSGAGTYAEFVVAKAEHLVPKPESLSHEAAGSVGIAGFTALQGLRDQGKLETGESVLVIGASGGVGTFAIQIAKAWGAEVTAVCSTGNLDMVRSIGADHVIDYTTADVLGDGRRYDVILDNVGNAPLGDLRNALAEDGRYVAVSGPKQTVPMLWRMLRVVLGSLFRRRKMRPLLATTSGDDLRVLRDLMVSGAVDPVIGTQIGLTDLPEALRRQGEGHAHGKTVVLIDTPTQGAE